MKKTIVVMIFLVLLSIAVYLLNINRTKPINQNQISIPKTTQVVGADRDTHGCIGSAGYSWCESKNKCLRVWEEACLENVSQEIQSLLAKKYNKPIGEVKITISKQDGNFVGGSVVFGQGGSGEGGIFLARKVGNIWEVVFDGNGSIDCIKIRQTYNFPDSILKPNFCD